MIPKQGTPEWIAWRRQGVGASDLPTIMGEDAYRSEYELALEKRGDAEPDAGNWATQWGHWVEPLGLAMHAQATGMAVRNIHTTTISKTHPHVYASLDGRVVGERRGVEVKLSRWDEVPRRVEVQCMGQMAVCRLDAIDVVRLKPYHEPLITTIERDDTLCGELLDLAEAWYLRYVLGDEMPPLDGSRGAGHMLDRVVGPPEMAADDEQRRLVLTLHRLRQRMKDDAAQEALVVNRLKQSMAGAEALTGDGFRITWKRAKPRTITDWRAIVEELRPGAELLARHTQEKDGTRPFRVTVEEE